MEFSILYGGLKDEKEHILVQTRGWNTKNCYFLNFLDVYAPENPQDTYTPRKNVSEKN